MINFVYIESWYTNSDIMRCRVYKIRNDEIEPLQYIKTIEYNELDEKMYSIDVVNKFLIKKGYIPKEWSVTPYYYNQLTYYYEINDKYQIQRI